jgi:hypothetical protein
MQIRRQTQQIAADEEKKPSLERALSHAIYANRSFYRLPFCMPHKVGIDVAAISDLQVYRAIAHERLHRSSRVEDNHKLRELSAGFTMEGKVRGRERISISLPATQNDIRSGL